MKKTLSNYAFETYMGLMCQVAAMIFMCVVFSGMPLLTGFLFIQFALILYTIHNLMEQFKNKVREYLADDVNNK